MTVLNPLNRNATDAEILRLIDEGGTENTSPNDFASRVDFAGGMTLWVDHYDEREREEYDDPRFVLAWNGNNDAAESLAPVWVGDDLEMAIKKLRHYQSEFARY